MSSPDLDDLTQVAAAERRKVQRDLRQTLLAGVALTVPFLVTVLILGWAFDAVSSALAPLADVIAAVGPLRGESQVIVRGLALAIVVGLVFVVGVAAQHGPDTNLGRRFDALMEDVPGVGSIYTSVERMSDVLLASDTESFREVKIVAFPREGSYAVAFLTAESPTVVEDATGETDLVTVFVPMAPNPVMGGHLLTVPRADLYDVDLTVEEGMEAVMTTGITVDAEATVEADAGSAP